MRNVASLLATVVRTQVIYLGLVAAAKGGVQDGLLVELLIRPWLQAAARFAYVTLAGRTEAPVMAWFRQFVHEHLRD